MELVYFVIYRHDNAFGNTAEQIICLAQELKKREEPDFTILVEHEWQKTFCLLIPGVDEHQVRVLGYELNAAAHENWVIEGYEKSQLKIPSYYSESGTDSYPCGWEQIESVNQPKLFYNGTTSEIQTDIVIQFRERGTWHRRVDGRYSEPQRDVNPRKFKKLVLHLTKMGYSVGRIGDAEQTPLPDLPNFIDFARNFEKDLDRDIRLIDNCKLFISSDSALWPLGIGLGKTTLITNVASVYPPMRTHRYVLSKIFFSTTGLLFKKSDVKPINPFIFSWIATNNSRVLYKKPWFINFFNRGVIYFRDNSYRDLVENSNQLLNLNHKSGEIKGR